MFDLEDARGLLRRVPRGARRDAEDPPERDHRVHRPVGLRQDHGAARAQPHARRHPRRARRRQAALPRRRPLRRRASRRPRCAAGSAWCSRSRTRSRRASTTTSRSARASTASASKAELDEIVEKSLRAAALWDEVKDRLKNSALGLSGGQQQRLCIARTIAVEPEVVLMDEPCSALDPIATARIEELMRELKSRFTIVIVTHNMQQAARVSDRTAFFTAELDAKSDQRTGIARRVRRDREDLLEPRATSGPRTTSPAGSAERDDPRRSLPRDLLPSGHGSKQGLTNRLARVRHNALAIRSRYRVLLISRSIDLAVHVDRRRGRRDRARGRARAGAPAPGGARRARAARAGGGERERGGQGPRHRQRHEGRPARRDHPDQGRPVGDPGRSRPSSTARSRSRSRPARTRSCSRRRTTSTSGGPSWWSPARRSTSTSASTWCREGAGKRRSRSTTPSTRASRRRCSPSAARRRRSATRSAPSRSRGRPIATRPTRRSAWSPRRSRTTATS